MLKITKIGVQEIFILVKYWKCANKYYEIRDLFFAVIVFINKAIRWFMNLIF